jgi:hypothetical protein
MNISSETVGKPKKHDSCTSKYLILLYAIFIKMPKLDFFDSLSIDLHFCIIAYISKIPVKLISKGGPQHVVPAFFVLGGDYNPNATPEILICLNKVARILQIL